MKAILRSINNFSCKLKQCNNLKYNISPKIRSNKFKSISGDSNITIEDALGKNLKDYKIYGNTKQQILPDGYTQVDYIESSGTQYIDTGVNADTNLRVILDMAYTEPKAANQNIGAIKIISGNNARYHLLSQSNFFRVYLNDTGYNTINFDTNRHSFDINPILGKIIIDNEEFTIPTSIRDTTLNFWLFGRNSTSTKFLSKVKQWGCKMYYNNILVRDFIPCYRNSDNEVGLYDLVNNVFYTNQGTEVFTYGGIAPTPDVPIDMVSCGDLITDSQDEHYGKYKIPVNVNNVITNIYLDEPLRKIDGYSDYIDFVNGKVVRNIKEYTLIGDEQIKMVREGMNCVKIDGKNIRTESSTMPPIFCNMLLANSRNLIYQGNVGIGYGAINNEYYNDIVMRVPNITTLTDFTAWLQSNNVTVDYVLATPTEEDIELPNINLIEGKNTITIGTEVQGVFEVEYYSKEIIDISDYKYDLRKVEG